MLSQQSPGDSSHRRGVRSGTLAGTSGRSSRSARHEGVLRWGRVYWIRYWYRGQEFRGSSGSDSEAKATKLLKDRIKQMGSPRFIGPTEERLMFEDLAEMLRCDYSVNGRRSAKKIS